MDNRQKKLAFVVVLLLGCVATSWLQDAGLVKQHPPKPIITRQTAGNNEKQAKEKTIQVYVSGAVGAAGIYELPVGARAVDAVAAAGGMRQDAKSDRVNMAKKLKDGSHVYVPFIKNNTNNKRVSANSSQAGSKVKGQGTGGAAQAGGNSLGQVPDKVNLNTATQAELMALPGIGEATANRIIAMRRVRSFRKVEDLLQVRGIGQAKLAKLRPYVQVD